MHVESREELDDLARLAAARAVVADVAIRVNLPTGLGGARMRMGGRTSRSGVDAEQVPELVAALRGINVNPGAAPEDMVSLQLWSDGQRLITLRREPLQTTRDIAAMTDAGHGPRDAGGLITLLVELMIARMNQSIVDMNDAIDAIEATDPRDPDLLEAAGECYRAFESLVAATLDVDDESAIKAATIAVMSSRSLRA